MRILYVTPYVPSLIRVRPFNFIKQLSRRHEITLVSLVQGDKDMAGVDRIGEYCERVHTLSLSKFRSLVNCCRRLLSSVPLQAAYTDLSTGRDLIAQIVESQAFDVLHVEHIRGAHLAERVRSLPRVYDSVDCITRLLKLRLLHERGAVQRALGYEELLKMRSYEPRTAAMFDGVVVTSQHDKRALEMLIRRFHGSRDGGTAPVAVVRNGVDSEYFRPQPGQVRQAAIVFSGKMGYSPNAWAALRFYSEVFPHVRRRRPEAKFMIVGSDPPDAVRKLARDPAVEVTGYVPDVRPHIASAEVVACPLTIGVGIQNKVLEAMAMAKPVVATSVACTGIPGVVDGEHLIRADDPIRMADAILRLFDSRERRLRMGQVARRFVEEGYSWDTAARELEAAYVRAIDASRGRALAAT